MTNKTERYYVVSESELVAVREAAYSEGMADADVNHVSDYFATRIEAEAACRAREVVATGVDVTPEGVFDIYRAVQEKK